MYRSNLKTSHIGLLYLVLVTQYSFCKKNYFIQNNSLLQDFINTRQLTKEHNEFDISMLEEHVKRTSSVARSGIQSHDLRRSKRSGSTETPVQLALKAYGEEFILELWHVQSVLDPDATIVTRRGDVEEIEWSGNHPDCFLRGMVTSHAGTASMSFCEELVGTMNDGIYEYHIETLPRYMLQADNFPGNVLLARRKVTTLQLGPPIYLNATGSDFNTFSYYGNQQRQRRATSYNSFQIEAAIYVDQLMYEYMENELHATTTEKKIELIMLEWNGVQAEYSKHEQLGYNVTILIKKIVFYQTNPSWYVSTTILSVNLNSICNGTKNDLAYDHVHLHTGQTGTSTSGMAYLRGSCSPSLRCAVSSVRTFTYYYISAHELGHTLGLTHDVDNGCPSPNDGIMGSKSTNWSTCSKAELASFVQSSSASCLFVTNIDEASVPANLVNRSLSGLWMGMMYTEDEYCQYLHGPGWRFREFPYWGDCSMHSCADMNTSSFTYGTMVNYVSAIPGRYCGDGKVCISYEICGTWATTGLDLSLFTVVPGGWGQWESWTSCSRTCGRGMLYRKRSCNNPKPKFSPDCNENGHEYDAVACNTNPCGNDSSDLKKQRATETCEHLIANGLINSTVYDGTGVIFHYSAHGQCEVLCNVRSGYTFPANHRYGLMPDGTLCTPTATLNTADTNGYPRVSGVYGACVQGYCEGFGCDNSNVNMSIYDGCGVCGGDNSTCQVYEGVFTNPTTQGSRIDMFWLPNGSYNIQFYFTWSTMLQVYIELWSKDNQAVLSSWDATSFIFDSRSNPTSFAGTFWTFFFASQYLYASGPLAQPVLIKLYQRSTINNTGVNYGYSTPLSSVGSTCTRPCVHGVWNSTLCGCICNTGYYGPSCNTTCNKICYNSGKLNEATCVCQCTEYWFGLRCTTCRNPFTGPTCTACKYSDCLNCGIFNSTTCRCECLAGYGGLRCETDCNNTLSTCVANAAAGNCVTDNVNMETQCNLACGLCVGREPKEYCTTTTTSTVSTLSTSLTVSTSTNRTLCENCTTATVSTLTASTVSTTTNINQCDNCTTPTVSTLTGLTVSTTTNMNQCENCTSTTGSTVHTISTGLAVPTTTNLTESGNCNSTMLKEMFQNQHPEDNVQEKTQTATITHSTVDGVTYPDVHIDVTENFPCISSVQMGLETSSCSIAVECQTDRILKRSKRTQAFVRGKQIDFGCQVNIHVQRRSKGIQCSLDVHTDSEMENKIDTFDEPDTDPNDDAHDIEDECSMIRESDDSSYKPDESDPMDSSFTSNTSEKNSEQPSTSVMSERKFIVFEEQLLSLFLTCHYCHGPAKGKVTNTFGTLIIVTQECHLCSMSYTWSSQPYIGDMPAGNIILSGAILFAGATPTKVLRVMHHMCIPVIHLSTFMTHQRVLLTPTINKVWKDDQDRAFGELQSLRQPIAIAGDGRCDSPGHSAMFGAYSVLEVNLGKVLDIELVQSNEVNSSYHMEKEGLARAINKLQSHGVEVGTIITDRHVQIQKWIRENMTATHYFDVWHVAKGLKKKLEHIAREKQCEDVRNWIRSISNHLYWCAASSEPGNGDLSVAKWHSVANHVQNRHTHENSLFPSCLHDCLPEANARYKWLQSGTKACVKIEEVVLSKKLAKDIKKSSPIHQTSNLEAFHSVVNHFAPKMLAFSYIGMRNRLHLAALHFNENANRPQAMTSSGTSRYQISFPKYKKGGYIVKEVKEDCTYKYVEELIVALDEMVKKPESVDRQIPPPLCSQFQRPDKMNAVQAHKSRFAR